MPSISRSTVIVRQNNDKTGYTASTVLDKTGYTASTVSDKTGYSLTAGSYVIKTSLQRGNIAVNNGNSSGTSTISAVTTAKASVRFLGTKRSTDQSADGIVISLNSTTQVLGTRGGSTIGDGTANYEVEEGP